MNPFISIDDLSSIEDAILIFCKPFDSPYFYSIPNSFLFILPDSSEELISKIQRLTLESSRKLICYDKGDLVSAGKVFWGLKAAGFEDILILLGGVTLYNDLGHEINSESIAELELADYNYLPFNNSLLKVLEDSPKKASYYQLIKAEEDTPVTTPRGILLSKEALKEILENQGTKYKSGKPIQVYGKYAVVVACILLYLEETHVSVMLEKHWHKESCLTDGGSEYTIKAYSVHENGHYDSTSLAPVEAKRESNRKAGNVCGNCEVF